MSEPVLTVPAEGSPAAAAARPRALPTAEWPLASALSLFSALAAFAWVRTVGSGANLLHFDAKAHLVVARRVLDSLTPGWLQLGAIWLPLPHILNVLPAQNDRLYQTGLFASALGFLAFVLGLAALGRAAARATRDPWAGVVAAAVPALNPGWLYVQATPLTEPLYFGLAGGIAYFLVRWRESGRTRHLLGAAGCSGLATLVRYEAWPMAAAWIVLALLPPAPASSSTRRVRLALALSVGLIGPVLLYGVHSWAASGVPFYAVDAQNLTEPRSGPWQAMARLLSGTAAAYGAPLLVAAGLAGAFCIARGERRDGPLVRMGLALLAPAAVTLTAYLAGHPSKARYPLMIAPGLALLLAEATRGARVLQALALALAALQAPSVPWPLPVLVESTRDRRDVAERLPVVRAMREQYHGGRILASLGSLAPVVFELGLPVREIVHEGNGNWWTYAVVDPGREVAWIMIARGDVLDQVRGYRPGFPESEGFTAVMGFRGVTIYRRLADLAPRAADAGPGERDHGGGRLAAMH